MLKNKKVFVFIYAAIVIVGLLFVFITPLYISHYYGIADLDNEVILDVFGKGKTYFGFLLIAIGVTGLFLERYLPKEKQ